MQNIKDNPGFCKNIENNTGFAKYYENILRFIKILFSDASQTKDDAQEWVTKENTSDDAQIFPNHLGQDVSRRDVKQLVQQ